MPKQRVDLLLVSRGLVTSRARAQALISAGKVLAAGQVVKRASDRVEQATELTLIEADHPYVSRGGLKLEGALHDLNVDVRGLSVADVGASTGGFTDCVLRHGAVRVYAIDVGHEQLDPLLRADPRVVCMEGVNARHIRADTLPEAVALVVVDASFISLTKLLAALVSLLTPEGRVLALVKPQFEVGKAQVSKRGVVRDDALRAQALDGVVQAARELGLSLEGHVDCRLEGPEGNREIFALFSRLRAETPAL